MKNFMKTRENFTIWALWIAALAAAIFLAASIETGRVHAANTAFTFFGALSGVITPNGDTLNDVAFLCFDNPKSSAVSGTIYDLHGKRVTGMLHLQSPANCQDTGPFVEKLAWDGKVDGSKVSGGVYIYQVQSEGKTITGTVMVVR